MWALATSRQAAAGARPATRLRHLTAALRASSCSAAASSAADLRYISQPASDAAGQAAAPQAFPVELYPPIEPYATGCAFLPARAPCNFDAATASPRTAQATMRVRTSTRGGALTQRSSAAAAPRSNTAHGDAQRARCIAAQMTHFAVRRHLPVGDGHEIYWEQSGNPVLFAPVVESFRPSR